MQLKPEYLTQITEIVSKNPTVSSALIFGSRAMGNARENSDVDIALKGELSRLEAEAIARELEDTIPTLLTFDVIAYERIDLAALRDHIDRIGVEFYRANELSHSPNPNTARA
jgi:predicted nucleotidyltransferase